MISITEFLAKKHQKCTAFPKNKKELIEIIEDALSKDITNLNFIDTHDITDMKLLFSQQYNWEGIILTEEQQAKLDVSEWDVSNVKNMSYLFNSCGSFNCDLSKWNITNVKKIDGIFHKCKAFNSDISDWKINNDIKNMSYMFSGCTNFNQDISKWDVSNVTDMNRMFLGCKSLDCDLSNWNTSKVRDKAYMFSECITLIQNKKIPKWFYNK